MTRLNEGERAKERSIAYALVIDFFCDAGIVAFAVITGSLTLIGEAVRAVLMLAILFYSFWIMRSVHRGRLDHFQFGVLKLEYFASALLGLSFLLSAYWIAEQILLTIFADREAAGPLGLMIAAIVNAVNTLFNVINWLMVRSARKGHQTEAYRSQLRARTIMMVSSLILQATLTAAALANDPVLAFSLDAIGSSFVCFLMLLNAVDLIGRSFPILLDWRAPKKLREQLIEAARSNFEPSDIIAVRTRRAVEGCFAELVVAAAALGPLSGLDMKRSAIENRLRELGYHVDLVIIPQAAALAQQQEAIAEREVVLSG
jgi:divalent metal cation (Fe/Co/Zn/Cd) transporter